MSTGPIAFDPYAVLQVLPSAEPEVVNAAFKALALKYHPDHDATRRAAEKMAELNRAYRHPPRRAHREPPMTAPGGVTVAGIERAPPPSARVPSRRPRTRAPAAC